ncbi:unnamed protein product [Orchesella dallaii]|uniref:Uncharacterized protein n=1 Tax=Orchesella dallaii TaxID=48710 RepID=A0ABP1Q7B4_9HEXA
MFRGTKKDKYYVYCNECAVDIRQLINNHTSSAKKFDVYGLEYNSPSELSAHPLTLQYGFFVPTGPVSWTPRRYKPAIIREALEDILHCIYPNENHRFPDLNFPEQKWSQLKDWIKSNHGSAVDIYTHQWKSCSTNNFRTIELSIAVPCDRISYRTYSSKSRKMIKWVYCCRVPGCTTRSSRRKFIRNISDPFEVYCLGCKNDLVRFVKLNLQ